jgi:hypothetical protein
MLLPFVLGSAGTLFTCQKKESIQQSSPTYIYTVNTVTQSTKPCVPTTIPAKAEAKVRSTIQKYTPELGLVGVYETLR